MHGCVTQLHGTVVTLADYEHYERTRPPFIKSLKIDLVSKTFLLLGCSFTYPTVDYFLNRIRVLLGTDVREYYGWGHVRHWPADSHHKSSASIADTRYNTSLSSMNLRRAILTESRP